MTVTTTKVKDSFVGDGVTADFAFTFPSLDASWVTVWVDGVEVTATITLNADQVASPGGTATPLVVPAAASDVEVVRTVPLTQGTRYSAYASFPSSVHEAALDKLTMVAQQLDAVGTGATDQLAIDLAQEVSDRAAGDAAIESKTLAAVAAINQAGHAVTDVSSVLAYGTTTARTLTARFADLPTILDFGADATGVADATAAIQAALDAFDVVVVPRNATAFRVSGTVLVNTGKTLRVEAGATLKRLAADSSTDPIVRLRGPYATVEGDGWIITEKASPRGIVHIGPTSFSDASNIQWPRVQGGLHLQGVKATGNIGICCDSSETHAGGGTTYNGLIENVQIRLVGTGIYLVDQVNLFTIRDVFHYQILDAAYHIVNCTENLVVGGSVHFSSNVVVIKLENAGYNHFHGVMAEPGGTAQYFNFDANCDWNMVFGHDNCLSAPVDLGTDNSYIEGRLVSTPRLVVNKKSVEFKSTYPVAGGRISQVGDIILNSEPGTTEPIGWRCIVAGTGGSPPGTWQAIGQAAAQVDSVAADVATLKTDFNALLAKLRSAGLVAP